MSKKYKTIDLCAGIGGVRRGFELAKCFENVLSSEIDKTASETYSRQFSYGKKRPKENANFDLTSRQFKDMVRATPYDVLLAGFPCQAFSIAGKRLGFDDPTKGTIFFHIKEIVAETKPKAIFLENVANLLSHDKGRTIDRIFTELDNLGYQVVGLSGNKDAAGRYIVNRDAFVRNTKNFGLPQNRPRAFIMAFLRDCPDFIVSTDYLRAERTPVSRNRGKIFSLSDIILPDDSPLLTPDLYLSQRYWDTLKDHSRKQKAAGRGFGYKIVYDSQKPELYADSVASTLLATGGSGKERNLVVQKIPKFTGVEVPGRANRGDGKHLTNTDGVRVMSPYEWGMLQGFVNYGFLNHTKGGSVVEAFQYPVHLAASSKGQMYKQFGNSVSIPLIEEMALYMKAKLAELEGRTPHVCKQVGDLFGEAYE